MRHQISGTNGTPHPARNKVIKSNVRTMQRPFPKIYRDPNAQSLR
jgi:hypothetical protein